jgi:probable rRNA maturation factor
MQKLSLIVEVGRKKIWPNKVQIVLNAMSETFKYLIGIRNEIHGKNLFISVSLTDDKTIHKMNFEYRNKDKPTNVLSFQNIDWKGDLRDVLFAKQIDWNTNTKVFGITHDEIKEKRSKKINMDEEVLQVGDIAISYERILEESVEQSRNFDEYLSFMVVHGVLHLMGYDHEIEEDAIEMEKLEKDVMSGIKIC